MEFSDLEEIVDQSTASTRALFHHKDIELVRELEPGLPRVRLDHDRIIQVLVNLISNAVKFTSHGHVRLSVSRRGDDILVGIHDTGVGIAYEDQQSVFERFKQVGDTLTEKPRGTGLGLPICRHIVETHGGRIWVESVPGEGSSFWFTLPLGGVDATLPRAETGNGLNGTVDIDRSKTELILVVDDDPSVRSFLKQVLDDAGFQTITADNGGDALDLAKQMQPDLITMDIMMPGMDGMTVINALREDPRTSDIPVVVVSALTSYGTDVADLSLVKPVDDEQIVDAIKGLLEEGHTRTRPCMVVMDESSDTLSDYLVLCPGEVLFCKPRDLWKYLDEGFTGTVFVPSKIAASGINLSRVAELQDVQVVILPG
jgi:CheY-like chemotaxis protein